jgi:hypothetical protein
LVPFADLVKVDELPAPELIIRVADEKELPAPTEPDDPPNSPVEDILEQTLDRTNLVPEYDVEVGEDPVAGPVHEETKATRAGGL